MGDTGDPRVHRIALGTGNPEGANGAYVISNRGVVVDPGPPVDAAWGALCAGIEDAGLAVGDVEHVLVTHWHADHAGLAPRLADVADATLVVHESDAPLVGDYADERERRVERDARRLREWGVSDDVVSALQHGDSPSPMPDSFPVRTVVDGDDVAGVRVVATPGHTLGHAAFDAPEGLFVGDLVLPTYTPNVGGGDTRMRDALTTYLDSLERVRERTEEASVELVHPGHGSALDLDERAEEIVRHHDERTDRVFDVVAAEPDGEDGGPTPWKVATELFGEMEGIHAKMGAGEAASHLEFLRKRGVLERVASEPVRYRVAADET